MSLRPMKPIPNPTKNPFVNVPPLEKRHPQLINLLRNISNDVCEGLGEDYIYIETESKTESTTLIVGKEGYMRLVINPYEIKGRPFIKLGSIYIRPKYRGKGVGEKWIKTLISVVGDFSWGTNDGKMVGRFGIILRPKCIVYGEGSYIQNKCWTTYLPQMTEGLVESKYGDWFRKSILENIEEYESIPKKLTIKRWKNNSKRLKSYYRRFGFSPYDKEHFILDMGDRN
jgi:GNAT superfamily N-acetyltransferase